MIDRARVGLSRQDKMDLLRELNQSDAEKEDLRQKLRLIEQEFFTLLPNLSGTESLQAIGQIRQYYLDKIQTQSLGVHT